MVLMMLREPRGQYKIEACTKVTLMRAFCWCGRRGAVLVYIGSTVQTAFAHAAMAHEARKLELLAHIRAAREQRKGLISVYVLLKTQLSDKYLYLYLLKPFRRATFLTLP